MRKSLIQNEQIIKKASMLKIPAHKLAESLKSGNFRSLYKGQGIEFEGVREYIRGDDVRSIDWNVTARLARPYVKIFREEREFQLFLIIDNSNSMMLNYFGKSKYDACSEAVALLTIAAQINCCPIGAVFFDGEINFSIKPKLDKNQSMLILNQLSYENEKKQNGSDLEKAINGAGKLLKKRTLVFIFSDFKTENWQKSAVMLAQKNDLVAVRITDEFDYKMPNLGTTVFQDSESRVKMVLPTSSKKFQTFWTDYQNQKNDNWESFCIKHGILPVFMKTTDDPFKVLNEVLKKRKKE